jgi:hypothetical protein
MSQTSQPVKPKRFTIARYQGRAVACFLLTLFKGTMKSVICHCYIPAEEIL